MRAIRFIWYEIDEDLLKLYWLILTLYYLVAVRRSIKAGMRLHGIWMMTSLCGMSIIQLLHMHLVLSSCYLLCLVNYILCSMSIICELFRAIKFILVDWRWVCFNAEITGPDFRILNCSIVVDRIFLHTNSNKVYKVAAKLVVKVTMEGVNVK